MFKFLSPYFSTKKIIKGFAGAFLLANFIFLSFCENKFLDFISPFLTFFGIYIIINLDRAGYFFAGFFTGILWFYWISFSFVYYDLTFLIPFVIFFVGIAYALIFWAASFPSFMYLRAILFLVFSYIAPFGFDWFKLEATLVLGIFDPSIRGIAFIFLAAILFSYIKNFYRYFAVLLCFICALQIKSHEAYKLPFDLEISQTKVPQAQKWDKQMKNKYINESLMLIDNAIIQGKKMILLPESAFPTYLDHETNLLAELDRLSEQIIIVAGAMGYEDKKIYNSAYLFNKGEFRRMDKLVLVPFGEEIPLPKFAKDIVNKLFFDNGVDYSTAEMASDYVIDGVKIRNAICYEATRRELYENGDFDVVFAITNNAWFMPSTQANLQKLLLKYYATKYAKSIYHSVNGSDSGIITPKQSFINLKIFE